jgi:dipeptidase E
LKGDVSPGIALDDGTAVHLAEGAIHRVVASRPKARGYRVCVREGSVQEEPLETEYLPDAGAGEPGVAADRPRD